MPTRNRRVRGRYSSPLSPGRMRTGDGGNTPSYVHECQDQNPPCPPNMMPSYSKSRSRFGGWNCSCIGRHGAPMSELQRGGQGMSPSPSYGRKNPNPALSACPEGMTTGPGGYGCFPIKIRRRPTPFQRGGRNLRRQRGGFTRRGGRR